MVRKGRGKRLEAEKGKAEVATYNRKLCEDG